jgi:endonuclease/exonuclease/phosphatase (EEP) superfamily protein YafD
LIQEITADDFLTLRHALQAEAASTAVDAVFDGAVEQAIISRFPLQKIGVEAERTRLLKARIRTPAGDAEVWAIHAYRLNLLPGRNFLSYGGDFELHRRSESQFEWLAEEIHRTPSRLILGGDFNVPYGSYPYRLIADVLRETHAEAGWGFGFTFPASSDHARWLTISGQRIRLFSPIRLVRIDHLFHSPECATVSARVLDDSLGSDHAPLMSEIVCPSR